MHSPSIYRSEILALEKEKFTTIELLQLNESTQSEFSRKPKAYQMLSPGRISELRESNRQLQDYLQETNEKLSQAQSDLQKSYQYAGEEKSKKALRRSYQNVVAKHDAYLSALDGLLAVSASTGMRITDKRSRPQTVFSLLADREVIITDAP